MGRLGFLPALTLALCLCGIAYAMDGRIVGTASVADGDTLDIGPIRIRLHGIDAPEAGQTCRWPNGRSWQCGTAAMNRLAELVEGRQVECTPRDRDAYGRIVAACRVNGLDINATLVSEGLARAFVRYSDDFVAEEAAAKMAGLGIWRGEAEAPWDYRARSWERAAEAAPGGCPIKGNISRNGERIYHTPWSPWYSRTRIDEASGERWFCDEAEAIAAGWRPARWR
jgi:endonuclease YncB( thermonuclease family)